jgi:hypothetical protein
VWLALSGRRDERRLNAWVAPSSSGATVMIGGAL